MTDKKTNYKAIIGGLVGLIIAVIIAVSTPPNGLDHNAMKGLAVFAGAIVWWVADVLPDYVTALLMCVAWVVLKVVAFTVAFSAFAGDTFWLLVGALGLGVAVNKSGLLNRTSLYIMSKFPATFKGQTAALIVSGNIIGPLIPSTTAKCALIAPFAVAISDNLGYKHKSNGAAGLFAAMYTGFGANGPLFLSASFLCYTMRGLLPKAVQEQFTWTTWFLNALPWGLTLLIGGYLAIQFLYKPETKAEMSHTFIKEKLAALGPMTRSEKVVSVVLVISLCFWVTERLHGIPAASVAVTALCVLLGFKVYDRADFRSGIAWDSIIFIGGILNLAAVLPALKVDKWAASILGPYVTPLLSHVYLFVVVMVLLIFLVRFVLVSQAATITIFTVLMIPFAVEAGINPWVPGFVIFVGVGVWNVIYQNSQFLAGYYAAGDFVEHRQLIKMSVAYMVLSIIGLLACVPVWHLNHLIP